MYRTDYWTLRCANVECRKSKIGTRGQRGEHEQRRPWRGDPPCRDEAGSRAASNAHHARRGRYRERARLADVELLYGRAVDPRRYGPRLRRDDGARGGGRIVALPVADNQFVHKGDALFAIDAADYRIALEQAQALTQRDGATLDYARKNEKRKAALTKDGWTSTDVYQQTTSTVGQAEGVVALDNAAIAKAQLDLGRTVIRSPVNGFVTNLLVRLGDYATVGQKVVSVVDTDSFWVDGYFEETAIGKIHEGDRATIELMGYNEVVRGHVDSVARGINVPNAQPDQTGLASVNPIFTWVRLAQRVPVRIHIDLVPDGVRLVSGTTATVQIDPEPEKSRPRNPY